MRTTDAPPKLLAGIDNLSLDTRSFDPSPKDIEHICRFFSLGKLHHFEQEKGIVVSHSNYFVYVKTTRGEFALKFYPPHAARTITLEYAVNRFLTLHRFPTPAMRNGDKGRPYCAGQGMLVTCCSYINAPQAWQKIQTKTAVSRIASAMFSLKALLAAAPKGLLLPKQADLTAQIKELTQISGDMASYDSKEMIEASLQDIGKTHQNHRSLFTRTHIHNNTTLTNLLVKGKTIYTLDLSHIREDYILSDLAAMIISCLFFETPRTTIKSIVGSYFALHKIKKDHMMVLSALVKTGLVKEYLKNARREHSLHLSASPSDIAKVYLFHLKARKKLLITALKRREI